MQENEAQGIDQESIVFNQPNESLNTRSTRTNLEFEDRYITPQRAEFEKEYLEKRKFSEKILIGSDELKEYMSFLMDNSE
jgi:hypothetical protein